MLGRIRSRFTYANVAATIALVLALGGGVVYAAKAGGKKVSVKQLKFPLQGTGVWSATPAPATGAFQTVLTETAFARKKGGNLLGQAQVQVDNTGNGKPSDVTIRMLEDGNPEGPSYTATIPANGTGSVAGIVVCNGEPAGNHTIQLQAMTSSLGTVSSTSRSLNVEVLPG